MFAFNAIRTVPVGGPGSCRRPVAGGGGAGGRGRGEHRGLGRSRIPDQRLGFPTHWNEVSSQKHLSCKRCALRNGTIEKRPSGDPTGKTFGEPSNMSLMTFTYPTTTMRPSHAWRGQGVKQKVTERNRGPFPIQMENRAAGFTERPRDMQKKRRTGIRIRKGAQSVLWRNCARVGRVEGHAFGGQTGRWGGGLPGAAGCKGGREGGPRGCEDGRPARSLPLCVQVGGGLCGRQR